MKCKMEGCFVIDAKGRRGGLAMLWKEGVNVQVQNHSQNHIDSTVEIIGCGRVCFTGFYRFSELHRRCESRNILRSVGTRIHEDWVIGGDFNEIMGDAEKVGGRRKLRAPMEEFRKTMDELGVVDIKLDRGWFTWTNNRLGEHFIKERIDRFFTSEGWLSKVPFPASNVIRQASSDQDAILLDTLGRKPRMTTEIRDYLSNTRRAGLMWLRLVMLFRGRRFIMAGISWTELMRFEISLVDGNTFG